MYYKVTVFRGHGGAHNKHDISFVFMCKNALSAMAAAKTMPSVKHGRGVLCVQEIDKEEYDMRMEMNAYTMAGDAGKYNNIQHKKNEATKRKEIREANRRRR